MPDIDFKWFVDNMKDLYAIYGHVFLAIKNQRVLGAYSSYGECVRETQKVEPLGTFIVQECGDNESAYTNYIASMSFR